MVLMPMRSAVRRQRAVIADENDSFGSSYHAHTDRVASRIAPACWENLPFRRRHARHADRDIRQLIAWETTQCLSTVVSPPRRVHRVKHISPRSDSEAIVDHYRWHARSLNQADIIFVQARSARDARDSLASPNASKRIDAHANPVNTRCGRSSASTPSGSGADCPSITASLIEYQ